MPDRAFHSKAEFAPVMLGGVVLAATAGFVNTVVLLLGTLPVTHLTGTVSRLSMDLGLGKKADAVLVGSLVLAFLLGAAASGVVIGASTLRMGRRYGVAVLLEAALIAAAALSFPHAPVAGTLLAAAAAGLQNAMASSYRSLIIRTTHVTGLLTDLGFMTGQLLGGHKIGPWRFGLVGGLIVAFVAGGLSGALAQAKLGSDALWIPATVLAFAGGGYLVWRRIRSAAAG